VSSDRASFVLAARGGSKMTRVELHRLTAVKVLRLRKGDSARNSRHFARERDSGERDSEIEYPSAEGLSGEKIVARCFQRKL